MLTTAMISGDFGIIHQGHLDHIIKAYQFSDWLYIVTHTDESIEQRKGYKPVSLWARMMILQAVLQRLGGNGRVLLAQDKDGKSVRTLEYLHPTYFIKGGDRTPETMPVEEIETCERLGIEIIYGVGEILAQSRDLTFL